MRSILAVALLLAAAGIAYAQSPTAESVLAANHAAVGAVPTAGAAEFDYAHTASGLTGTRTDRVDLATGGFVEAETAGRIADARGYDGQTPWQRDISGANTAQQGGDRVPAAVNEAYRLANLWWRPAHAGATIVYTGRKTVEGRSLDHLVVTPKGGKRFDAWFDADTHMLARVAEDRQFLHTGASYADYRREGGLMWAHAVAIDDGAGGQQTLTLKRFALGPSRPLSAYSRPTAAPLDASIEGGAASTTVPFRLLNNHIYVQASVNGKGPYTFLVDTGGHTLLSPRLVSAVGLKPVGTLTTSGVGETTSTGRFVEIGEIALGAVRLRRQVGVSTEIYDRSIEGIPVDGMVGFELFRRLAVQIDYGRQTMTLTDPARFDGRGSGTKVPFVFYDHLPMVAGSIDGAPARLDIDTGSRSEFDITSPFIRAHQLRSKFPKGVSAVTGWGVGGPARAYVVRLPTLTLGGVRVDNVVTGLSESRHGSMSDPNVEGNVGSGLLKRFVVTFDYAHQTLWLKPLVPAPIDAGRFDRSGMWINAGPGGYVVTDVSAGGPAAKAGIAVGDVVASLDGQRATPEGLSDARTELRARPAGASVQLVVKRGGQTRRETLVLADQI